MKALQDRSIAQEGVIARLRKCNRTLTDKQEQYKEALRTLNKEMKELRQKVDEKGRQKKNEQEAKAMVEKKLTTLLRQMEMAKADAVKEFKASQPFIDSCSVYYGDEFEDFLKEVKSIYLNLDLSKVTMDDPLLSTPAGNTILDQTDDSIESELDPKDDSIVLAQLVADPSVTPLVPSTEPLNVKNPPAQDVQDKNDENPHDAPASLTQFFIF